MRDLMSQQGTYRLVFRLFKSDTRPASHLKTNLKFPCLVFIHIIDSINYSAFKSTRIYLS